jgi:hypothetical protein
LTVGVITLAVPGCRYADRQHTQPLNVYVFIGHNNAKGFRSRAQDLPDDLKDFADPESLYYASDGWKKVDADAPFPTIGFVHRMRQRGYVSPIGVMTHAVPFSTIAEGWNPEGGRDHAELLDMVQVASDARAISVDAIFNINGQNDARDGAKAAAYAVNQARLIHALRGATGNRDMVYISIRTHDGGYPHLAEVRQGQMNTSVPGYGWINTDEIPRPDRHHYTHEGYLQLGALFADKLLAMRGTEIPNQ